MPTSVLGLRSIGRRELPAGYGEGAQALCVLSPESPYLPDIGVSLLPCRIALCACHHLPTTEKPLDSGNLEGQ